MYSQKNNLKVFVSSFATPNLLLGTAIKDLPEGQIAFFDDSTDQISDSDGEGFGYFAINKGGTITRTKSFLFTGFTASPVLAYAAPTAEVKAIAIPAPAGPGEYFQVSVVVKAENNNGDIVLYGVAKSITGDTAITMAGKLYTSLNAAIQRNGAGLISVVDDGAGNLTVTGARHPYSEGRKVGKQVMFNLHLTYPQDSGVTATVTASASEGIGQGDFIHLKETLSIGNSDSVSRNEFGTAYPLVPASSPSKTYNMLSVHLNIFDEDNSAAVVPIPQQVILAFDSAGTDAPAHP